MLLVQFSVHTADKMECLLMFAFVEFFVCRYCRRWVCRSRCPSSGAHAVNIADPAARSPAAAAAPHTRQRTHTHLVSCLIAFLNYHNFDFQIFWSLVGGCVYEKSSIDKIGQKWFEPHPDQIWLHWSMLMTMTMQIVVRLVEADGVACLLDGWKN